MTEIGELRSSPEKKKSAIWKEFYENSTLHGLRNVFTSENLVLKIAWLVLILTATSYFLYSTVDSFQRYFEFPITIHLQENMHENLPFPSITICSDTLADKDKIYANDNDDLFIKYELNISACAATADVRAGAPCGHALVCAFAQMDRNTAVALPNCTEQYQVGITEALAKANIKFDMLEFIKTFGESWDEVLTFCLYGFEFSNCTDAQFFKTITKGNRLCHTLNDFDAHENVTISSDNQGSKGGMWLLLRNRPERYFYPKYTEGYQVYIHERGTGTGDSVIPAPPGKLTKISIQKEEYSLLEKGKGGKCVKKNLQGYRTYHRIDCYDECMSDWIKKQCGCRQGGGAYNDAKMCTSQDTLCVLKNYMGSIFSTCDCPIACSETKYPISVRYGQLASHTIEGVPEIYFFAKNYNRDEYVGIEIFYESHRAVIYEQSRSFTITALFGEVGGNMGLLLGCSVMTLAEFLFLIISLLMNCFRARGQVRDTTNGPMNAWK